VGFRRISRPDWEAKLEEHLKSKQVILIANAEAF
jgi:hypothetical protein